ncbi:MAG TPA: sigma-54 dependent transcriptional regulator [Acidobacteriota bacterium]
MSAAAGPSSGEPRGRIAIIDDEPEGLRSLSRALERVGFEVLPFGDGSEFLARHEGLGELDAVVTDLRMPGADGMQVLRTVKERSSAIPVLLITAYGSVENAVEAMKSGADDYMLKPVDLAELRKRVENAVARRQLERENEFLRRRLDEKFGFGSILGNAPAMRALFDQLRLVAPTHASVLLVGESGTGKELVANALHQNSPRRERRFLPLNCGAISPGILESELFGHERGAFTGAVQRSIGKLELAHRGTLFLDEIGEIPQDLQVKLLRVLEEREFMRVGGQETVRIDVRLIAATNTDLERAVEAGKFRKDLYYRLKVVTLRLPPLRERREDIALLSDHFLRRFAAEHNKPLRGLSPAALQRLVEARWEGNVRELRNTIESAVVLSTREIIEPGDLPAELARSTAAGADDPAGWANLPLAEIERRAILSALDAAGGNRSRAARELQIGLRTLQRKLKEYHLTEAPLSERDGVA